MSIKLKFTDQGSHLECNCADIHLQQIVPDESNGKYKGREPMFAPIKCLTCGDSATEEELTIYKWQ